MRGILIDVNEMLVKDVTFTTMAELNAFVGGYLELAYAWRNGDMLYVNEYGLRKNPRRFFSIPERSDQLLAGNGLVVGQEYPGTWRSKNPYFRAVDIRAKVTFLAR